MQSRSWFQLLKDSRCLFTPFISCALVIPKSDFYEILTLRISRSLHCIHLYEPLRSFFMQMKYLPFWYEVLIIYFLWLLSAPMVKWKCSSLSKFLSESLPESRFNFQKWVVGFIGFLWWFSALRNFSKPWL